MEQKVGLQISTKDMNWRCTLAKNTIKFRTHCGGGGGGDKLTQLHRNSSEAKFPRQFQICCMEFIIDFLIERRHTVGSYST